MIGYLQEKYLRKIEKFMMKIMHIQIIPNKNISRSKVKILKLISIIQIIHTTKGKLEKFFKAH